MKNSNKVLLAVISCFLLGTIFVAATTRAHLFTSGRLIKYTESTGKNITKNFNVGDFSELDMSGFGHVLIKSGKQSSVSVSTDEGYLSNIDVSLTGNKLNISTERGVRWEHDKKVDIVIVTNYPLEKITLSGASHLDYTDINSSSLVLEMSGASHCNLVGKINSLYIETSGASHVNAKNLIANDVKLETSGAANIAVYVKNSLEIHATGMAHINYYGNPKNVVRDVAGMASINSVGSSPYNRQRY